VFADGEHALEDPFGLRGLALRLIKYGEIGERAGDVGMAGAQRLLLDRQRALEPAL
jgi:hypothetical protein